VFESITQLLIIDSIVQVQGLIVCSPLSGATQPGGKQRLILDLRYVKNHVYKQTIKFEDWPTALEYSESGSFFTELDVKSGWIFFLSTSPIVF
jgi:hypothetical protein